MRSILTAVIVLFGASIAPSAPTHVQLQAHGKRPQIRTTIEGVLEGVGKETLPFVRIGIERSDFSVWKSAIHVDMTGRFIFSTDLAEGYYFVVAAIENTQLSWSAITISPTPRTQTLTVHLQPSDLDIASLRLPRESILSNAQEPPPPPPPPPPPAPSPVFGDRPVTVTVLYATDRRLNSPGSANTPVHLPDFVSEPGPLRYGHVKVTVSYIRPGAYSFNSAEYGFVTNEIVLHRNQQEFQADLSGAIVTAPTKEVLLLVHGYNTAFEDGIWRTAQLLVETGFRGVPVYFGWPGGSHWWDYPAARDQLATASADLAQLLKLLASQSQITRVHVLAHSLGNSVLVEALNQINNDRSGPVIGEFVMAAPDVNTFRFNSLAPALSNLGARRTIYVSDSDRALLFGQIFNHAPRVGERNPITIVQRFDTVDASKVHDGILGHSYFVETDEVAHDIGKLLAGNNGPLQRGLVPKTSQDGKGFWELPREP